MAVWQPNPRTADVTVTKIAGYVRVRILMNRWFFQIFGIHTFYAAGQPRHNSSNVGGVTASQVGHNSSYSKYHRKLEDTENFNVFSQKNGTRILGNRIKNEDVLSRSGTEIGSWLKESQRGKWVSWVYHKKAGTWECGGHWQNWIWKRQKKT